MHFSALRNSFAKYFADLFAWHWGRYQASWPGNPWSICLGGTRQNDVIGQWRKVKTGYTVETNSSRIQAFAALPSWRALQWTRTLKGGAGIGSCRNFNPGWPRTYVPPARALSLEGPSARSRRRRSRSSPR